MDQKMHPYGFKSYIWSQVWCRNKFLRPHYIVLFCSENLSISSKLKHNQIFELKWKENYTFFVQMLWKIDFLKIRNIFNGLFCRKLKGRWNCYLLKVTLSLPFGFCCFLNRPDTLDSGSIDRFLPHFRSG